MAQLEPLRLVVAKIRDATLIEPVTWIDIEPELLEWSRFMALTVVPRYGSTHWETHELESNFFGYLGQKIFESYLLELKVPHLPADPVYKDHGVFRSIGGKSYDFFIPNIETGRGSIEVKTTPPDQMTVEEKPKRRIRFMANVERWQDCDYAVAIKVIQGVKLRILRDRNGKPKLEVEEENPIAYFCGYLYGHEVKKLPIDNFSFGDAYWTFLDPKICEEWNRETHDQELKPLPLRPASDFTCLLWKHRVIG